jgi:MFS family permease
MPRLPRARLSDFDGLYSVYSLPNIVLPLVGGMIVDRWGVAKSLCLFTLLILLGQAIFAAACRCATLHSPPPPRTPPRPTPPLCAPPHTPVHRCRKPRRALAVAAPAGSMVCCSGAPSSASAARASPSNPNPKPKP